LASRMPAVAQAHISKGLKGKRSGTRSAGMRSGGSNRLAPIRFIKTLSSPANSTHVWRVQRMMITTSLWATRAAAISPACGCAVRPSSVCLKTSLWPPCGLLATEGEQTAPTSPEESCEIPRGWGRLLTIDALQLVGELTDKLGELLFFLREAAHKQCGTCCREAPRTSVLVK
jgi:hypothetical protein